jgi:hypothetical protein
LLILGFAVTVAVMAFLFWIIWINRESELVTSVFFKTIAAPIIVALAILVYELAAPLPDDKARVEVMVVQSPGIGLLPVGGLLLLSDSSHANGYMKLQSIVAMCEANGKTNAGALLAAPNAVTDLLELAMWDWLGERYPLHWDVNRAWFQGLSGGGGSISTKRDAEAHPRFLSSKEIRDYLSQNSFIKAGLENSIPHHVCLPSGSRLERSNELGARKTVIETPYVIFSIQIQGVGGEQLGAGSLAEKIKAKYPGSWWAGHYVVSFDCKYRRFYRWSPATAKQKAWVTEIIEAFKRDFDWQLVREDLRGVL